MKTDKRDLTAERLRSIVSYDPNTGRMVRTVDVSSRGRAGNVLGTLGPDGYLYVRIDLHTYMLHRLAWLYMTGSWPAFEIDHINTTRDDNRFCNLREATSKQNKHNTSCHKRNPISVKGVSWHKPRQKWRARLHHNGKEMHLGLFNTIEEARAVYAAEAVRIRGQYARLA